MLRRVFPEGAGYLHDELGRRDDLTPAQRQREPLNGDSHLAFIGGGLRACVTSRTDRPDPIYLLDLDGIASGRRRERVTTLVGYTDDVEVARVTFPVPMSSHPIDAVNLKDPRLGLYRSRRSVRSAYGHEGRVRLSGVERAGRGLTVNEYEPAHASRSGWCCRIRFGLPRSKCATSGRTRARPFKAIDYARTIWSAR
jgi:hypothetical protein